MREAATQLGINSRWWEAHITTPKPTTATVASPPTPTVRGRSTAASIFQAYGGVPAAARLGAGTGSRAVGVTGAGRPSPPFTATSTVLGARAAGAAANV